MDKIKNIIEELGIAALENSTNIAAVAVVSDSGNLIYQTSNWDLRNQTHIILEVINGAQSYVINAIQYSVVRNTTEGIIGTNESGMGHVLFVPFQGGVLVSYALPNADPPKALSFLKSYAIRLNGMV